MVWACKEYITDKGFLNVWEYEYTELKERIMNCIELYEEYDGVYQDMKTRSTKEFHFSEMYTFGKFKSFCESLRNILDMFNIIKQYNAILNINLEGFEPIMNKYKVFVSSMQKKGYDLLDQRKDNFEHDLVVSL